MRYDSLKQFLRRGRDHLARGPIALILAEDAALIEESLQHHAACGFTPILFAPPQIEAPEGVIRVTADTLAPDALRAIANPVIAAARPGTWLHIGYNAEFLMFPFRETRHVADLCAFAEEERRAVIPAPAIDLYAGDLENDPEGLSLQNAWLDAGSYYALARQGPEGAPLDRQAALFGGLRWRLEDHVPPASRDLHRPGLIKVARGLRIGPDLRLNRAEMNTLSCPWHRSPTAALCSFRTAKALRRNPASRGAIRNFRWPGSRRFDWDSRQLMTLGLMEPGQWV
ncbi:hypothetical protein [Pseudoroseicyclus aestuarii]|uniref:Glycosyl transferase family 2 n=1 Tax=Pseudoroseicyclus aestuarii TaxID=1795041 RepID=A0A318SUK4_9RHOB|nr:hypothetical protein [Pseudoroseicyclus aestuarii]PYE84059.1 hypothetical protein DFP88_103423 [Pseudoroseicyclus aestuarii]